MNKKSNRIARRIILGTLPLFVFFQNCTQMSSVGLETLSSGRGSGGIGDDGGPDNNDGGGEDTGGGNQPPDNGGGSNTGSLLIPATRFNGFIPYKLETQNNIVNWTDFEEMSLPPDHFAILGYGTPLWADEPLGSNGKLKPLTIGYTHLVNVEKFHKSKWSPQNNYSFVMGYDMVGKGAEGMINAGQWDYARYGNPSGVLRKQGDAEYGKDWTGITFEGALELGKRIHYQTCCGYDVETGGWSINLDYGSWVLFDEENFPEGQGAAGSLSDFLGGLQEGFKSVAPNRHIAWYGRPITWSWLGGHDFKRDAVKFNDSKIEQFVNQEMPTFNTKGFRNTEFFFDLSTGYAKTPYIHQESLYEKNPDGSYKIVNGKRVFRRDDFDVTNFGHTERILGAPTDYILSFNMGHADVPDTFNSVHHAYHYANVILANMLMLNRMEYGNIDITKYRKNKHKGYVERRPRTEPWTFGGNSEQSRELGEEGIKFEILFAYLSGVTAISLWDDARFYGVDTQLPNRGTPLFNQAGARPNDPNCHREIPNSGGEKFPCDDNYGRFKVWTAAMQTFAKAMKGTDQSKWQYVRFYYPIKGGLNDEIISTGIYTGNAFKVMFAYPSQDPQEVTRVTLQMGAETKQVDIKGREVYFFDVPAPAGLTPHNFSLSYKNIYQTPIKVNGVITSKIRDHYMN